VGKEVDVTEHEFGDVPLAVFALRQFGVNPVDAAGANVDEDIVGTHRRIVYGLVAKRLRSAELVQSNSIHASYFAAFS
jgi:hypothetical protein